MNKNSITKSLIPYFIILVIIASIVLFADFFDRKVNTLTYGEFISDINEAKVEKVIITPSKNSGVYKITGKEKDKLDAFKKNKPTYDSILETLTNNISDKLYMNPECFAPVLSKIMIDSLGDKISKKDIDKLVVGLSFMDKNADIQKDKKGEIIWDKDTKDTELVPYETDIDDYMDKEVLPHIPDARAFFEENLNLKKPVIKTGAEIPFTRYFYKYQQPTPSEELKEKFIQLEHSVDERIKNLFGV